MKIRNRDRSGRFALSFDLLATAKPDELAVLFSGVTIYRAEPDVVMGMVVYHATSPMFREVKAGEEAPWYCFIVSRTDDGNVTLEVQEATESMWVHQLPVGYGEGMVQVPAGLALVDRETGEEVGHG